MRLSHEAAVGCMESHKSSKLGHKLGQVRTSIERTKCGGIVFPPGASAQPVRPGSRRCAESQDQSARTSTLCYQVATAVSADDVTKSQPVGLKGATQLATT